MKRKTRNRINTLQTALAQSEAQRVESKVTFEALLTEHIAAEATIEDQGDVIDDLMSRIEGNVLVPRLLMDAVEAKIEFYEAVLTWQNVALGMDPGDPCTTIVPVETGENINDEIFG